MKIQDLKSRLVLLTILSASLTLTGCAAPKSCQVTKPILVKGHDYNRVGDSIDLTPFGTQEMLDYIRDLEYCAL
ncbi:hypothetical protein VPHD85_0064 [Vibrio phage D85]